MAKSGFKPKISVSVLAYVIIMCQETEEKKNLQLFHEKNKYEHVLLWLSAWQGARSQYSGRAQLPQEGGHPSSHPSLVVCSRSVWLSLSFSLSLELAIHINGKMMGHATDSFGTKTFFTKLFIEIIIIYIQKSKQITGQSWWKSALICSLAPPTHTQAQQRQPQTSDHFLAPNR